jgi:hypothetical protein
MRFRKAVPALAVAAAQVAGGLLMVAATPPASAAPGPDWVQTSNDSVVAAPLASRLGRSRAGTAPSGYALTFDNAAWLDGDYPYTISIRSGSEYSPLRATLGTAASQLNRFDPTVQVRTGTVDRSAPVNGEILVEVTDNLPTGCLGPNVVGCGGVQTIVDGTGLKSNVSYITSGHVWIPFRSFQTYYSPAAFQQMVLHELGHALGFAHFDGTYDGQLQVMHSTITNTTSYQHGDDNGLLFLHANGKASPIGDINDAQGAVRNSVVVWGWTVDPDAPMAATRVDIYVDGPAGVGRQVYAGDANLSRPDVAAVFPGTGSNHGFETAVGGISPGPHPLYFYAINIGVGKNVLIGTRTVTVPTTPDGSPIGSFEGAIGAARGSMRVWGWTIDPSAQATPSDVHVYVEMSFGNWKGFNLGAANVPRPDIGASHPGVGDNHGFSTVLGGISPGIHAVAVYAINAGAGSNVLLGMASVTVPS